MPWKGVTVTEERERFLEDWKLDYHSVSDLADRFGLSRKTAHKWISRYEDEGEKGFHEHSRRPSSSPWQTVPATAQGPGRLLNAHATGVPASH